MVNFCRDIDRMPPVLRSFTIVFLIFPIMVLFSGELGVSGFFASFVSFPVTYTGWLILKGSKRIGCSYFLSVCSMVVVSLWFYPGGVDLWNALGIVLLLAFFYVYISFSPSVRNYMSLSREQKDS